MLINGLNAQGAGRAGACSTVLQLQVTHYSHYQSLSCDTPLPGIVMTQQHNNLISIVIPTFNRREDLRQCLASIKRQANKSYEVVVIDDAGTDQTDQMMREGFPEFRYSRLEFNSGPSHARNVGITNSRADYILFLDSDTRLQDAEILDRFLTFFRDHPDAGAVGGEVDAISGEFDIAKGRTITFSGNSEACEIPAEEGRYCECDYLATCCCMTKQTLIEDIGGFDPFYGFGAEDKDLGYRIQLAGYKNYLSADCAVEHYHSSGGRSDHETFLYITTRMRFVLKWFPFHKQCLMVLYWLACILAFYLLLLPKVVVLVILRRPLVKEHFTTGYLTFRALVQNLLSLRRTIASRKAHFIKMLEAEKTPNIS